MSSSTSVTVMTQNVCNGVDDKLDLLPSASSSEFSSKVADVYQAYFTRSFPERATALAAEIRATKPHLIGLQEAILVHTRAEGSTTPIEALDYVEILRSALAAGGLKYDVAVQSNNLDVEVPTDLGFHVRHTDREVILVRADLNPPDFKLSNRQKGNFETNLTIPSPIGGTITFRRGWAAVDVTIQRTASFRLISTHLDRVAGIRRAQVAELLRGPAMPEGTPLPVVLVGDFNSPGNGDDPTYKAVTDARFKDAAVVAGVASRFTCFQKAHLLNPASNLDKRFDFIFFRGNLQAQSLRIVGDTLNDRTPSRFWPSDHAGVVATLQVPVQD